MDAQALVKETAAAAIENFKAGHSSLFCADEGPITLDISTKNYRSIAATDYFSSWKYSPRSRLFGEAPRARTDGQPAAAPVGVSANSAESAAAAAAAPNAAATAAAAAAAAGKPLTRVKVAYAGKVGMAKLKRIVTALGGENVAALNSTV